jgi:hemerythrin-like domain-containing protein
MTPIEILKHEHEVILMVLDAAQREAETIGAAAKVDAERIREFLDFFRNFADRCHHAKEENHLFRRMVERGFPSEAGPIAVMLAEHDQGRAHLKAVEESLAPAASGDASAAAEVHDHLIGYAELLRQHIDKENNVLYVMAEQILAARDQAELSAAFEKVEAEEMGEGTHDRFHQLAHELAHSE